MLRHVRLPPVGKDIKDGGSVRMETGFVAGDDISVRPSAPRTALTRARSFTTR